MSTYLLLRDNKESGPYSKDDLVARGLKAYDLIWVQGKSAAWRYPSEIPELKEHAPVVEEQPFDRFFRKESQEKKPEENERNLFRGQPREKPQCNMDAYKPRPGVFVAPPAGSQSRPDSEPLPQVPSDPVPPTITVSENPAAAQIKYSQPLDEIKEMYVKTLQERKQKLAFRTFLLQSLRKASVILLLVAVGVLAGFMIKSNRNEKGVEAAAGNPMQTETARSATVEGPHESMGGETINETGQGENLALGEKEKEALDKLVARSINEISNEKKASKQLLGATQDENSRKIYEFQNSVTDPSSGERSRNSRTAESSLTTLGGQEKKTPVEGAGAVSPAGKDGLLDLVTVKSNEYRKVAFGGIRDLELTVANNSDKHLDEVLVELQYLKPSELPLRTENIRFKSIEPNSTATIRIPDTNRGIKVAYRIVNISR